jgi:Zn-dependent protease
MVATLVCRASGISNRFPDLDRLLFALFVINRGLLIFNLLPIFPLDGGRFLRSLLWYVFGRARSLQIAAVLGLIGVVTGAAVLVLQGSGDLFWVLLLAWFLGSGCIAALQHGPGVAHPRKAPPACRIRVSVVSRRPTGCGALAM